MKFFLGPAYAIAAAIRNETTSGRRVIKTIQQQNDLGVVRAPKGEQNSSVEKARETGPWLEVNLKSQSRALHCESSLVRWFNWAAAARPGGP